MWWEVVGGEGGNPLSLRSYNKHYHYIAFLKYYKIVLGFETMLRATLFWLNFCIEKVKVVIFSQVSPKLSFWEKSKEKIDEKIKKLSFDFKECVAKFEIRNDYQ